MKLILDTLERARLAANFSDAITLADAIADLDALGDALTARGLTLAEVPDALAPSGLLDAVQALYLACGDEDSEEAEAVASLPSGLNDALADVIRYGSDL